MKREHKEIIGRSMRRMPAADLETLKRATVDTEWFRTEYFFLVIDEIKRRREVARIKKQKKA